MTQLLIHLWGDYILQSDWMAQNKTKDSYAAFAHALMYSALFVLLHPSLAAWLVIFGTHFLIDRFRLARYIVWAKNLMGPKQAWSYATETESEGGLARTTPWQYCKATGYPPNTPVWLATWLLIISDNVIHLTINMLALRYL